jgi:hypothetical protein
MFGITYVVMTCSHTEEMAGSSMVAFIIVGIGLAGDKSSQGSESFVVENEEFVVVVCGVVVVGGGFVGP